jgi:hypothetical protein
MSNEAKKLEGHSPKKAILEGESLITLVSPYWKQGFKTEAHDISKIHVSGNHAVATCSMSSYFTSPDEPRFHLSPVSMTNFLCQIGGAHALFLNGHAKNNFEVMMTDFSLTVTKQVSDPKEIPIRMDIFSQSMTPPAGARTHSRTFYKWRFDIGEGASWGTISLCFPF